MKKNFKFADNTDGILTEDNYHFQLHSEYDFTSFDFDNLKRGLTLTWLIKPAMALLGKHKYKKLLLTFEEVSFFKVQSRDSIYPYKDDKCLNASGYLYPEDIDTMNAVLFENDIKDNKLKESCHMIFIFQSEMAIKIYSETVRLSAF